MGSANEVSQRKARYCDRDAPGYLNGYPSLDDDYAAFFGDGNAALRRKTRDTSQPAGSPHQDDFQDTTLYWGAAETELQFEELLRQRMDEKHHLRDNPGNFELHRPRLSGHSRSGKNRFRAIGLKWLKVLNFLQLLLFFLVAPIFLVALMLGKLG